MIERLGQRLVELLTSQDTFYGNTSGLEAACVGGIGFTILVCVWGLYDAILDLMARRQRNKVAREQHEPYLPMTQAATIKAWGNVRNAAIWLIKSLFYEAICVFAASFPPVPPRAPGTLVAVLIPVAFLAMALLLVFQVLSERTDRERTWEVLGQKQSTWPDQ